jgi:PAS domain S-box-containing protein
VRAWCVRRFDALLADNRSLGLRYGLAVGAAALAWLLTRLVQPVAAYTPFLFYFPAVLLAAVAGGRGPGALVVLLGLVLAPVWSVAAANSEHLVNAFPLHTLAFLGLATAMVALAAALRTTRRGLLADRRRLTTQLHRQWTLLDHVHDAICVVDPHLAIRYWNHAAAELYGWPAEAVAGKNLLHVVGAAAEPGARAALLAALAGDVPRFEARHYQRSGAPLTVEAVVSALAGDGGLTVVGGAEALAEYVIILRDITARTAAEAQLRALSAELEQRVAARTAELQHSNAALDQFAALVAHDLKAPLRGAAELTTWIGSDGDSLLSARAQRYLTKLAQRLQRMETLLDDMLAYARAGRGRLAPEWVEIRGLLAETVEFLNLTPGFTVVLPPEPLRLYTEREPLATVLRNLIYNACKHHHAPAGGSVWISVEEEESLLRFVVADDGPGIAPQHHGAVFELFRTLRPRAEVEGSGLGLSLVQKIVTGRGGSIELTSKPGAGATFTFTWPKSPAGERAGRDRGLPRAALG